MTERKPELYIGDILASIQAIKEYTQGISTWQEFRDRKMVFDAVVRNFEIIGLKLMKKKCRGRRLSAYAIGLRMNISELKRG